MEKRHCRLIFILAFLALLILNLSLYHFSDIICLRIQTISEGSQQFKGNRGETIQYGVIKPGRKYAVFASSLHGSESRNYAFNLPLSAMAWQRIGFDSVIIIVGDPEKHKHQHWVEYLMKTLIGKEYIVLLVLKTVTPDQATTISQVSRLFAASLVNDGRRDRAMNDIYMLTADADIWPIAGDFFDLPEDKDILHGNIGTMSINGVQVTHAPLSYVGMNVRTWYDVMTQSGSLAMPNTTAEIIKYFGRQFHYNVTHGGRGWSLDQRTISLRIHQWKLKNDNTQRIHVYERNFKKDRIDRVRWPTTGMDIDGIVDAHVLSHSYRPEQWKRLRPLLVLMFPDSDLLRRYDKYADTFFKLACQ